MPNWLQKIKDFLAEAFNPTTFTGQLWHDAGHAVTTPLVALLVSALGAQVGVEFSVEGAIVLGWVLPILVIEGFKDNQGGKFPSRDSLHDVATYLPAHAVYLAISGEILAGFALLVAIASSFLQFYQAQFAQRADS